MREPIDEDWLRDTEAISDSQRCLGHDRVMRLIEIARAALQVDRWVRQPMDPEYGFFEWDKYSDALHATFEGEATLV